MTRVTSLRDTDMSGNTAMQKYVQRRLSFSAQEIKEALIQILSEKDKPYPAPSALDVHFDMTATGVTLTWAEDYEENF